MSVMHSHGQVNAALQTGWLLCVCGQARIAVVAFLSIALVLVILSADRMHNLTCVHSFLCMFAYLLGIFLPLVVTLAESGPECCSWLVTLNSASTNRDMYIGEGHYSGARCAFAGAASLIALQMTELFG